MMNRVEMKEEMMEQINGGGVLDMGFIEHRAYVNEEHLGCGGHIMNHYNPFAMCECDKCGKKSYLYADFFPNAFLV